MLSETGDIIYSKATTKAIAEVCGGNSDTEVEFDWQDGTYHVPLYARLSQLDLAYSPLWTRLFHEYDWYNLCPMELPQAFDKFFEYTQGMGRDRHDRVLTNDFNACVDGQDDSTKHFCESEYLQYIVFQNKSQLRGHWILIIYAGHDTRAFYCPHGEDVISTLNAGVILTCDKCDCVAENYTSNYEPLWTEDTIIFQEIEDSHHPDYEEPSPDQMLLPLMPEPVHNIPLPKWRIDPEELDYYEGEQEDYLLYIHGLGPICPRCRNGVLS